MARSAVLRDGMKEALIAMWSTILVRGLVGIAFGICAPVWPAQFLKLLTFIFGGYAHVDGGLTAWRACSPKAQRRNRALLLASDIVSAVIGLAAILIPGEIWLITTGVISILFGATIIANWAWGVVAVASLIGIAVLAIGVVLTMFALRLRRTSKQIMARIA